MQKKWILKNAKKWILKYATLQRWVQKYDMQAWLSIQQILGWNKGWFKIQKKFQNSKEETLSM